MHYSIQSHHLCFITKNLCSFVVEDEPVFLHHKVLPLSAFILFSFHLSLHHLMSGQLHPSADIQSQINRIAVR